MCGIKHIIILLLWGICVLFTTLTPVLAENETVPVGEEITVPVVGETVFKYSPAGYQTVQPDGVNTTLSEFNTHQLVLFLTENQSVLSVDAITTNMTLDEAIADEKSKMETKKDYTLVSEENTTLAGQPAYAVTFSYTDELGDSKETKTIIAVNNGLEYVLMSDAKADGDTAVAIKTLIDSFEFVPVQEDNISKMIKTKMKDLTEPDKHYRRHHYTRSVFHYYTWDYYYDWCFCHSPHIRHYCWCW